MIANVAGCLFFRFLPVMLQICFEVFFQAWTLLNPFPNQKLENDLCHTQLQFVYTDLCWVFTPKKGQCDTYREKSGSGCLDKTV